MIARHAVSVLVLSASLYVPALPQSISIPLRVADNGGHFDTLWFGQDPTASYCVDPGFGESELPPSPPTGYYDSRWLESRTGSTCLGLGMKRDFRPGDDTYKMRFQPGYGGYPFTLSWGDLSALFTKPVTLKDIYGGVLVNVNMKGQSSVVITHAAVSTLLLTIGTEPGSNPLAPTVSSQEARAVGQTSALIAATINPNGDATSSWIEWGETIGYGQASAPQSAGSGSTPVTLTMEMTGLLAQTVYQFRVAAENSVGVTYGGNQTILTIPAGTIGERILPITVENALGKSRTVWLGVHDSATVCLDAVLGEEEMPPIPVSAAFDARLVGPVPGTECHTMGMLRDFRQFLGPDHGDLYEIKFQAGDGGVPVTLRWPDASPWYAGSIALRDVFDGSIVAVDMKTQSQYVVTLPITSLYVVSGSGAVTAVGEEDRVPGGFSLTQNYPNPFNPSTTVDFSLPVASRVAIAVYSVFGQKVATLVDGMRGAGNWKAVWEAGGSPSGVYYCTMSAGSFTQTRKILLVR